MLKYAGKLDRLAPLRSVQFPVLQTKNIAIELSQVKLYLPETHQWYDFAGTAARVDDEEGLQAGIVGYETRQVEKLTEIMRGSNRFSKSAPSRTSRSWRASSWACSSGLAAADKRSAKS